MNCDINFCIVLGIQVLPEDIRIVLEMIVIYMLKSKQFGIVLQ